MTRTKLLFTTFTTNLAGLLSAVWIARLVRAIPASETSETALMAGYYVAIAIVAVVDALLIDELWFAGSFRRTYIGGQRPEDDVEQFVAGLRRSNWTFPAVVIVCGLATSMLFGWANRRFERDYRLLLHDVGILHRGEPPEQVEALQRISILRGEYLPKVAQELRWAVQDGLQRDRPDVARWAAWGLGRLADQPRRNGLVAPLQAAARSQHTAVRREAAIALGRIQHRASAPLIQSELLAALDAHASDDTARLTTALGMIQVMSSLDALEQVLYRGSNAEQSAAAWALAQHRDQQGGRAVAKRLEQRLPTATPSVQCAVVIALTIVADEHANLVLMRAYDAATVDQRNATCVPIEVSMRPDGAGDEAKLSGRPRSFAVQILAAMGRSRATTPSIRAAVEPWLQSITSDPSASLSSREGAQSLLKGIETQRDDGIPMKE